MGDFKVVGVWVEEKIGSGIREGLNEVKGMEGGEEGGKRGKGFVDEV